MRDWLKKQPAQIPNDDSLRADLTGRNRQQCGGLGRPHPRDSRQSGSNTCARIDSVIRPNVS